MKVYSLVGGYDYEGQTLLGVFGSKEDVLKYVEQEKSQHRIRPELLGHDSLGYVESDLGQPIDFHGQVEWL